MHTRSTNNEIALLQISHHDYRRCTLFEWTLQDLRAQRFVRTQTWKPSQRRQKSFNIQLNSVELWRRTFLRIDQKNNRFRFLPTINFLPNWEMWPCRGILLGDYWALVSEKWLHDFYVKQSHPDLVTLVNQISVPRTFANRVTNRDTILICFILLYVITNDYPIQEN